MSQTIGTPAMLSLINHSFKKYKIYIYIFAVSIIEHVQRSYTIKQ